MMKKIIKLYFFNQEKYDDFGLFLNLKIDFFIFFKYSLTICVFLGMKASKYYAQRLECVITLSFLMKLIIFAPR